MKPIKNRKLYWALIGTFSLLYLAIAFVSTLHAITFFQLANTMGLSILLGAAYEIGQASVLFSILMTDNKNKFLAWSMMFLLTVLQVTANVYASFKFMDSSGTNDWQYWQRAILFAVQAESAEMYKVIISWISGALLPLVALGMTALVAENIRMANGEEPEPNEDTEQSDDEIIENEVKRRLNEEKEKDNMSLEESVMTKVKEEFNRLSAAEKSNIDFPIEVKSEEIQPQIELILQPLQPQPPNIPIENVALIEEKIPEINLKLETKTINPKPSKFKISKKGTLEAEPVNKIKSWHLMKEYVDDEHNVFKKGKFIENDPLKIPTSKKV